MTDKTSWSEMAGKELRGKPLESLTWDTLEGIKVQPLYTAEDATGLAHMGSVPGQEPYTRGRIFLLFLKRKIEKRNFPAPEQH